MAVLLSVLLMSSDFVVFAIFVILFSFFVLFFGHWRGGSASLRARHFEYRKCLCVMRVRAGKRVRSVRIAMESRNVHHYEELVVSYSNLASAIRFIPPFAVFFKAEVRNSF